MGRAVICRWRVTFALGLALVVLPEYLILYVLAGTVFMDAGSVAAGRCRAALNTPLR